MIVTDIEVVPQELKTFPAYTREYLLNSSRFNGLNANLKDPVKIEARRQEAETIEKSIKQRALCADTGKIISIGLMVEAYTSFINGGYTDGPGKTIILCGNDEKKILKDYWEIVREYGNETITFNGIDFDIPYIIKRSAYQKVTPSRNITGRRYQVKPAFDILQVLTNWRGLKEALGMGVYCDMFGVPHTKDKVSGADVYELYLNNEWETLKNYSNDDIDETFLLFMRIIPYYIHLILSQKEGSHGY